MPPTDRRTFLCHASRLGAAWALAPAARAAAPPPAPRFRISLAQWSLHRALFGGELDPLDFARTARERFGIEAVEYVNSFFKTRAADFAYLREMKQRAADAGVQSRLIMIDGEGALAAEDAGERRRAVENHFKWLAAAGFLGCGWIRVNAAGSGDPEEMQKRAADSLVRLAELGAPYGVNVIVENHGGLSSNGQWLAGVMRLADDPRVGTLPDFGNFDLGNGQSYDRYQGVRELMPFAQAVSAKSYEFDEAGNETRIDYRRMMQIVVSAGYDDYVGVEYEGSEHSEPEGIELTKRLLERVRDELS